MSRTGILHGVGVGPGDPELITLKALKVLQKSHVIFAASSTSNEYSIALDIVRGHVDTARVTRLPFPMTRDRDVLEKAWRDNTARVLEVLRQGHDASFITLGDPLTYSTFGYLMETMKRLAPDVEIKCVPGITSFNAAGAKAGTILAKGEETCQIVSGALGAGGVEKALASADNAVVLKTYRHFQAIKKVVKEAGKEENSVLVSRCGLQDELILRDISSLNGDSQVPYLSLMIVKKGDHERQP